MRATGPAVETRAHAYEIPSARLALWWALKMETAAKKEGTR